MFIVAPLSPDTRQWKELKVIARTKDRELNKQLRGVEPPRRYGHACVQYDGKVYLFGGRNDDDGSFKVNKNIFENLLLGHFIADIYNIHVQYMYSIPVACYNMYAM